MGNTEFKELRKQDKGIVLERIADWLDTRFTIPGTRIQFGLDALIGIIPGGGNIITTVVSVALLGFIVARGLPFFTALKMAGNILLDFLFSSIPLLGVIFDVGYKSNTRNLRLFEKHLEKREPEKYYYGAWILLGLLILLLIILSIALLYGIVYILNFLLV